jgi:hypothetical protein
MPVDRFKSTWKDLGRVDPLWAVLTDPERRHGGWDVDEFLATGTKPIAALRELVDENGLSLGDTWPSGQLIRLGNHWWKGDEPVTWDDGRADLPHDVAPGAAVELELKVVAPQEAGEYQLELDVVQEAVAWWAEVGSTPVRTEVVVSPDAVAIASAPGQEIIIAAQQAPHERADGGIEMFGVDTNLVRLLFAHCGSQVVNIVPDDMAGPDWESFTYVIRRGETV